MKTALVKKITLLITLVLTLGLFSCNLANKEETTGSLKLKISEEKPRTLLPDISMEPSSFEIKGKGPEDATFTKTTTKPSIEINDLVIGEWALTVTALNKDGLAIASGSGSVVVQSEVTSDKTIIIQPYSGNGSLNLTLNWEESDVSEPKVVALLTPLKGEKLVLDFTVEGKKATYSNDSLTNGYYTLTLKLLNNEKSVFGTSEMVRIVKDQTTIGAYAYNGTTSPITGSITTNIDVQMANPLNVNITGGSDIKKQNDTITLTASIKDFSNSVKYAWSVNGDSKGTEPTFIVDGSYPVGQYNISVTAISSDELRAGSESFSMMVIGINQLSFDSNGGSGTMEAMDIEVGSIIPLRENTFTNDGFIFTGWNTSPDGTGTSYEDKTNFTMGYSDITLYAQWEKASFITKWVIENNKLDFPLDKSGTYDFEIDWGDGAKEQITGTNGNVYIEHTYDVNGEYTVVISGKCEGFGYTGLWDRVEYKGQLLDVLQWSNVKIRSGVGQFAFCDRLSGFSANDVPDTSNIEDMSSMFFESTLFNGDISNWDTTSLTNMDGMFGNATSFNQDISGWNTSKVTNMRGMFGDATSFNQDISGWDTSNVTNMESMFWGATSFNKNISGWDTSNVTNMGYMFCNAKVFDCGEIETTNWKWVLKENTDTTSMFEGSKVDRNKISWLN